MDLTINLNAKLQPMHRHDLEDALEQKLEDLGLEAEITGGGTAQNPNGEIASCDIELALSEGTEENIKTIITIMEAMLAPVGSQLIVYSANEEEEARRIPFGVQEGLGLYLNGTDLDEQLYKYCDVNVVYEEVERLLGDFKTGHIASYWEGEETAFYVYGEQFEEMEQRIRPFLDSYPLCQKCRVVKIA